MVILLIFRSTKCFLWCRHHHIFIFIIQVIARDFWKVIAFSKQILVMTATLGLLLAQPMLIYPGVNSLAPGYINWYFSYIANIFLVLMISQLWFYKVLVMASIFTQKKLTELIELIFNIILPLRNKELTHPSHWCNKDLHYMVYMKSCPNQKASSHHWNQQWLNASYKLQSWQKFSSKYIFIQKMCLKMLSAMRCQVCRALPLC